MHKGQSLAQVAAEITNAKAHKKDYIASTTALRVSDQGKLAFTLDGAEQEFAPNRICLEQIGDHAGIPRKYADRMAAEAPALFAQNVNHWFKANPAKRMLRTLRNGTDTARAFLSDKYRPLDNADIAERILPVLQKMELTVKSIAVTETRLYIQAVTPRIEAQIKRVGDLVQSGIVISNSEIGMGSLNMRHMIETLRCTNGMIAENIVRQAHVGRKATGMSDIDTESAQAFFSDETRQADDRAFWLKIGDLVKHTLSREKFDAIISRLNATTEVELTKPNDVIEVMAERFDWQAGEKDSVLAHLIRGGDLTQYGLLNAVTRTAEDLTSYDRAIEFEKQGGEIMLLQATDFSKN